MEQRQAVAARRIRDAIAWPVDGVLFSLSYTVIPKPMNALEKAWEHLRHNRRVVIMDGKIAHGLLGRLSRPIMTLISKVTVLGDPDRRPWEDLKKFTPLVETEEVNFGTYYVSREQSFSDSCFFPASADGRTQGNAGG